jgi:hypothetical protein
MKKIYLLLTGILFVVTACNESVLDVKPSTFVSDEVIWKESGLIEQTLANIYGTNLCAFTRKGDLYEIPAFSHIDLATDDGNGKIDAAIQLYNIGGITASNAPYAIEYWRENYSLIRKANNFMEGIANVGTDVISAEVKKVYSAEARFLRAFSYFELVKTFGGVPLIKKAQVITDSDILLPRNTIDEVYQFIFTECDQAAADLPINVVTGHASKGAAFALKAKAMLYYASPLNNPANNVARWTDAATAAKVVMNMGKYSLFPDYRKLFLRANENNSEVIFDHQFKFPEAVHTINVTWGMWFTFDTGTWGGFSPTQDIVDAYEMTNGLPITNPASGYDPNNPYKNRDSRLAASIVYNGSTWRGSVVGFYTDISNNPQLAGNAETNKAVACGYGLKKFDEQAPLSANFYNGSYAQENNWIYSRYAEVLLNFAEAQNETAGPDAEVYSAINQVRTRAGQPDLPVGLSKDEMRTRIWNERRVELVYEEHRFFDVRRWKKGMDIFNQPIHEALAVKQADGSFIYTYPVKETRTYKTQFDFLPIPIGEIEKNPKLVQNPGY